MWAKVVLILGAYLLGSIPQLYLLGRLRGFDLRNEYDLHISLWRKVGPVVGLMGVAGDFAKGIIPIVVANALGFEPLVAALGGLAAVVGQMWPVFFKFDGEKGNSTGLAMAGTLVPRSLLIILVPMLIGVVIRTVPRWLARGQDLSQRLRFGGAPSLSLPLAMAIGFALFPLSTWCFGGWFGKPLVITLAGVALFALIMIRRLTAGLREDLKTATDKKNILINRFLFDRSYR